MIRKWLAGLLALFVTCAACAAHAPPPPKSDPVQVTMTREVHQTMHAEVGFSPPARSIIDSAAKRWRDFTQGRADIRIEYDLDLEDDDNTAAHFKARHGVIIGITSDLPIAKILDERTGATTTAWPVAVTTKTPLGAPVVYLYADRIQKDEAEIVVTHELGHVLGLPDLPTMGAIMSGAAYPGLRAQDFGPEDVALCRAERLCL